MKTRILSGRRAAWAIVLAAVILGGLLVGGVRTFRPRPSQIEPADLYALRQSHPNDIMRTFTVEESDLFLSQPGSIAPPANPEAVLAQYADSYDEDGFRRPIREADHYPIIVIGTSIAEGQHAPVPWPDVLAAELDTPVQNMAVASFNPPDYAQVMHLYGTREPRDWVLVAFFEGQNFINAIADGPDDEFMTPLETRQFLASSENPKPDYGDGPWKYPIDMQLGDQTRPLAFFEFYLWWLNGQPETYIQSLEMAALRQYLESIKQDAGDACVMLVYEPIKPHVYLPFVTDPASQTKVIESAWRAGLEEGRITIYPAPEDFTALVSRLGGLSAAVEQVTQEIGIYFVDTTGPLQAAAAQGEEVFYTYDTHWNQRAHQIAGQAIADAMRAQSECRTGGAER